MNDSLQSWVSRQWLSLNLFSLLLLPLSLIFCALVVLRRSLYQLHIAKSYQADVPIVIIGNISVGGTGKTPLLLHLVKELQKRQLKVAVISRGYKSESLQVKAGKSLIINDSMSAHEVGDEPYLISRHANVPVVIGRKKSKSVELLLKNFDCDVILSDDGLQHYALARDIEICVFDATKQFGNKLCLPAGPLRERPSRLKSVDFVIAHQTSSSSFENTNNFNIPGQQTIWPMSLSMDKAYPLSQFAKKEEYKELKEFKGTLVHAIAGIGQPQRFFNQLVKLGIDVIPHPFNDHFSYTIESLNFQENLPILMTEKDAVKCLNLFKQKINDNLFNRCWVVPVDVELSSDLISQLTGKIMELKS
ncbi:MAG: tetraacyldisaccharide 4'-kinase [Gammaproteobacteria bacterium]|nr:tetraacyldisaccharide 4'-kinase [Gammaproteobacteria bacterium]